MQRFHAVAAAAVLLALPTLAADKTPVQSAIDALSARAIAAHTKFLASDLLEGRGPGTRGDELAVSYVASQFESFGLEPAGDNGTFLQRVPLIGVTTLPAKTSVSFEKDGAPTIGPLGYLDDFVGADATQTEGNTLDSELVFVGHGVVAPEYKWDDYKGLDARGKTLVMLVDDPPATASEPDLFKGKARTYYGRWTYKFEIGTARHADGVILIHTTDAAGYDWPVVRNSWSGEQSSTKIKVGEHALRFQGWITNPVAQKLFASAGLDLARLTAAASSRSFKPVSLGYRIKGSIGSTVRPFDSHNVIARLRGSDPGLRDEAVFYTAHHDHLGIGKPDPDGDAIYNGAGDNATGTALLLDLARAWSASGAKPARSIYFAAVAAEEQGLLGSEYLGQHPPVPAGRVALALNYDNIYEFGRVSDVELIGSERMNFYPTVQRVAREMSLEIKPDALPEQGYFYRSDHFSLAKNGVPAFSIRQGPTLIGKPAGTGAMLVSDYRSQHYHQPSDEFDPSWDFDSAVQMGELGIRLGWEAANTKDLPTWNAGDEFRAARDKAAR